MADVKKKLSMLALSDTKFLCSECVEGGLKEDAVRLRTAW